MGGSSGSSGPGIGTVMGALGGATGGAVGGQNQGNMFTGVGVAPLQGQSLQSMNEIGNALTADSDTYQHVVGAGDITGQLFGQNGQLPSAIQNYNNLVANPGLTAQDQTAYGQASGNIARMFGTQEQGAAQSLADRGLSNSGVAGATFSGINGNKQEQLAGLQTQIAQNRENLNMQRMGQLQNYISQLGGLGNQATGQAAQIGQGQGQLGMGFLNAAQGQSNAQLEQQQQTQRVNPLGGVFTGGLAGYGMDVQAQKNQSGGSSGGGIGDAIGVAAMA